MSSSELTLPAAGARAGTATGRRRRAGVGGRLLASELRLVLTRRKNLVLLGILALVPILLGIAVKVSAPSNGEGPPFLSQITDNGLFLVFTSLTVTLPLFLPLAVAVASGDAIAGEAQSGTLRNLLVVPVGRTRMLVVKYAGILAYGVVAVITVAVVGLLTGLVLFPHGSVLLLSGSTISYGGAVWRAILVAGYVAVMLAGVAAIGLFLSTLTEVPMAALAGVAVLVIAVQIAGSVPQIAVVHPYLFTDPWLSFGDLLRAPVSWAGPATGSSSSSPTSRCSAAPPGRGSPPRTSPADAPATTSNGGTSGAVARTLAGVSEMAAVRLPGGRRVEQVRVPAPAPGHGQVLLRVRASSICGSDIRAIYREHLGKGPEAYQGVIAGHEPCGEVVEVGPGCRDRRVGDRVVVYHIAGCGLCEQCRAGYLIGCTSPARAAYGWQRDGGHAEYLLADEVTCLPLPEPLTFADGALVSCGFGTAYEGLLRLGISGRDRLLVTGLGPVGLAACQLGRALGAREVIGVDVVESRLELARSLGLVDYAVPAGDAAADTVAELTGGAGCETTIDCSGSAAGRLLALRSTRTFGRCAFVGEGGELTFPVSDLLIHHQVTLHGSWVTSLAHMGELLERLVRWDLHPELVVTDRFPLADADAAYRVADAGAGGKVVIEPAAGAVLR